MQIGNPECFYVVLRDDDARLRRYSYADAGSAASNAEACRLAALHPGHKFYVMKCVRAASKNAPPPVAPPPEGVKLEEIPLTISDDLPV